MIQGTCLLKRSARLQPRVQLLFSQTLRSRTYTTQQDPVKEKVDEKVKRTKNKYEKRTEAIIAEIKRGYFGDFKELIKTKGKLFESATSLNNATHAYAFPKFNAKTMTNEEISARDLEGKVTLVSVCLKAISVPHAQKYTDAFYEKYKDNENIQLTEFHLVTGYFRLLLPLLKYGTKGTITDPDRRARTIMMSGGLMPAQLAIRNEMINYIFLVDAAGKIRWKASGEPTANDLKLMFQFTEELNKARETQQRKRI